MKLSICIPTRNRQSYAVSAVEWINKIAVVDDFEIILCDNSDNPNLIKELLRVKNLENLTILKLISSEAITLLMNENWERCLNHSIGEWVVFIGDDDFVDPNSIQFLNTISRVEPEVDFIWNNRTLYSWPDCRQEGMVSGISLLSGLKIQDLKNLKDRILNFESSGLPTGLAPYHNFMHRSLIDRQRAISPVKNTFFFHENTDYIIGYFLSDIAKKVMFCERPLTIMGVGKASNSAALQSAELTEIANKRYKLELEHSNKINQKKYYSLSSYDALRAEGGDNFNSKTIYVLSLYLQFMKITNKVIGRRWLNNLLRCLEIEYLGITKNEEYAEQFRKSANTFIKKSSKGALPEITRREKSDSTQFIFHGYSKEEHKLYVSEGIGGNQSAGEFYYYINQLLVDYSLIGRNYQVRLAGA